MRQVTELKKLLDGYRLVTAEILYRMPDHPKLLQSYIWQDYDIEPKYPDVDQSVEPHAEFRRADFVGAIH